MDRGASSNVLLFCRLLLLALSTAGPTASAETPWQQLSVTTAAISNQTATTTTATDKAEQDIDDCYRFPCLHGATCVDGINSYTCVCPRNFNGTHCENDLAAMYGCQVQPCFNQGSCLNLLGAKGPTFICMCHPGYIGVYCETTFDPCRTNLCEQGTCFSGPTSYTCDCTDTGFSGVHCNEDINECKNSTICGGYPCTNHPGGFSCLCPPGYDGISCKEVNECTPSPCQHGGTCTDGVDTFTCACAPGYTGAMCEANIDECTAARCQHGGICFDRVNGFTCQCLPGYEGTMCELDTNECSSNPCVLPNMVCVDQINSYQCVCLQGFSGRTCEININYCNGIHCENGGECLDGVNDYFCNCTSEWMGKNCTEMFDACSPTPCLNGATCTTDPPKHYYRCTCLPGFWGVNCQDNIDDCVGNNCLDFQQCYDGIDNYTCGCPIGYTGARCESKIITCDDNPCQNNGTCIPQGDSYKCDCQSSYINITSLIGPKGVFLTGYSGTDCENDINECAYSDPPICQQQGKCDNSPPGEFTCYCRNFEGQLTFGRLCQDKGDYCDVRHPGQECQNGGTCFSLIIGFMCACDPGFEGRYCEININDCSGIHCENGGECLDGVNDYFCSCTSEWMGKNCTVSSNACSSTPCLNGATCTNDPLKHNYRCTCLPGFWGVNCQDNIDDRVGNNCLDYQQYYDGIGNYTCGCAKGYTGLNCESRIDECQNTSLCQHGSCDHGVCNCTGSGWQGVHCELDVDECSSTDPICLHDGNCTNTEGSYKCSCTLGYEGHQCENPNCSSSICQHGGSCHNNSMKWWCMCPDFVAGDQCDVLGPCFFQPCQISNTKMCSQSIEFNNYTCSCNEGWRGVNCTEDVNECTQKIDGCVNGTCSNTNGSYICDCQPGFTGRFCEVNIDECESKPCEHGGVCRDGINNYTCKCDGTGYDGITCSSNINECAVNVTLCTRGSCTDLPGSYECSCTDKYLGSHCELDNPCYNSTVCRNDGKCQYNLTQNGSYVTSCLCPTGHDGATCEKVFFDKPSTGLRQPL